MCSLIDAFLTFVILTIFFENKNSSSEGVHWCKKMVGKNNNSENKLKFLRNLQKLFGKISSIL